MECLKHDSNSQTVSPSFPAENESLNASFGKQEAPAHQIQMLKKRFRRTKDEMNNYLMLEQKFKNSNFAHLNFHNYNQKVVQDIYSEDFQHPVKPLIKSQSNEASIKSIESLSSYEKEIILQEFCEVQPEEENANKLADLQTSSSHEVPIQKSNEERIYFVHNKFQDDFDDDNFDEDEFVVDMNADSENNFDDEDDVSEEAANQCQSTYLDNSPPTYSISTENSDDNMQSFDDERRPPQLQPSIIHEAASFSIRLWF